MAEKTSGYSGGPLARYIEKKRELAETSNELEKARSEYREKLEVLNLKRNEIKKKEELVIIFAEITLLLGWNYNSQAGQLIVVDI